MLKVKVVKVPPCTEIVQYAARSAFLDRHRVFPIS